MSVELDLRNIKHFQKIEGLRQQQNDRNVCSIVIVGPEGMNQTTTLTNFSVDVNCIVQRVNLPLLRLLHQFTAMYENVKQTRLEMRSNRVHSFRDSLKGLTKVKLRNSETDTPSYKNEQLAQQIHKSKEEVAIVMPDEDSDSDVTLVGETIKSRETTIQPKCWKTMFYLLDLYETKPQTKTVIERISSLMQSGVQ